MIDKETFIQFKKSMDSMAPPAYAEDQRQALSGQISMTQPIFDRCVMCCVVEGNIKELFDLFEWFPHCGKAFCAELERDLDLIDAHMKKKGLGPSPEAIQARWDTFWDHVRVIFDDETADDLPE